MVLDEEWNEQIIDDLAKYYRLRDKLDSMDWVALRQAGMLARGTRSNIKQGCNTIRGNGELHT